MSSPPLGKSAAEDGERADDAEVAAILAHLPQLGSDPAAWRTDTHGDLDWAYSTRAVRAMSDAELLRLLTRRTIVSIPAREYNPSAPFVQIRTTYGPIPIPHGYRTPLSFVVKYIWESTLEALKDEKRWKRDRVAIYHLWRTCESLLRRAEVKGSAMGGMEKTWRCVPFDRLVTRFYKHYSRCDPAAVREFAEEYTEKEYERDIQKHDWKRWCMRGLNGVQMSEDEVVNGITDTQFKRSLRPADDAASQWYLDGKLIPFISDKEDPGYTSTSDLTDFDMDDDLSDADAEGDKASKNAGSSTSEESGGENSDEDEDSSSQSSTSTEQPANGGKRARPNGVGGDDSQDRAIKRVRIENPPPPPPPQPTTEESHYRYIHNHIYPLTRTLAAMAKKNAANANANANGSPSTAGESHAPQPQPQPTPHPQPPTQSPSAAGPSRVSAAATSPRTVTQSPSAAGSASAATGAAKLLNRPRTFLPYGGSGFSTLGSAASGSGSGTGSGFGFPSAPAGRSLSSSTSALNGNGGGASSSSQQQRNAQNQHQHQRQEEEESDGDGVIVVSSRNVKTPAQRQSLSKPSGSTPTTNGQHKPSPLQTSTSNASAPNPSGTSGSAVNGTTSTSTANASSSQPGTTSATNGADPSTSANASSSNQLVPVVTTTSAPGPADTNTTESVSAPAPPKPKHKTPTKRGGPVHAYDAHHSLFLSSVYQTAPRPRQTRAVNPAGLSASSVYHADRTGSAASTSGRAGSVGKGKEKEKDKSKEKGKEKDKDKGKDKDKSAPPRVDLARVQKSSKNGESSSSGRAAETSSAAHAHEGPSHAMDVDTSQSSQSQQRQTSLAALKEEQDVINAKALELLVNLVDAKEVLRRQFLLEEKRAASTPPAEPAATQAEKPVAAVPAATTSGDVSMDGTTPTPTTPAPTAAVDAVSQAQAQAQALLSPEERRELESKFHDFEGRFNSVKEELMGIVGRLQSLEKETREQREKEEEERRIRVRNLEERLRVKEEEERQEREFKRKREEEDRELERERRRVAEEEEKERQRLKREEEEARARAEREREEKERLKRESMKSVEVECRPVIEEMSVQTEAEPPKVLEERGVQHEVAEEDVEMGEPTVFFAECAIQTDLPDGVVFEVPGDEGDGGEKASRRILPLPQGLVEVVDQGVQVQTEVAAVAPHLPPEVETPVPVPPREMATVEIQTDPLPAIETETVGPKDESTPTPTTATNNALADIQMQVDGITTSAAGSEADAEATATGATAVNGVPLPLKDASTGTGEEAIDPRAKVMTSNLSLLVDNLVSAKMVSVMDNMLKARTAIAKPSASPTTTSPDRADQADQADQPTSPTTEGGEVSPSPGLTEAHGSVLIATLLDELKAMKEEARLKSQREKEEMEAIRQLHSAEVDALRRRLSYLESQNRFFDAGGVGLRERSASVVGRDGKGTPGAGANGHGTRTPTRTHSIGPMDGVEPTSAGGESGAKTNPTPTPTSERTYSFPREGGEGDNMPLPSIKSQRKHHIAFPRAHFG